MLGIIVGVASLIVVFAIGEGGKYLVVKEVENFGSNLIFVKIRYGGVSSGTKYISADDANLIVKRCPALLNASAVIYHPATLRKGKKQRQIWIIGTDAVYKTVRNSEISKGRFITDDDVGKLNRVCVLDEDTVKDLFGNENPLGEKVKIGFFNFKVIGVIKTKTSSFSDIIQEKQPTILPISIVQKFAQTKQAHLIFAQAKDYRSIDDAALQIKEVLGKKEGEKEIEIKTLKDIISAIQRIVKILSLVILGVAGVSLLVGGIGIMNIMLTSVVERTKEIGIRKAVGAKEKDLLLQFLTEAGILSTLGGVCGIILGAALANIASFFAKWPPLVSPKAVFISFLFSAAVGIFFGLYPAQRAARQNPVDALRYE